MYVICNKDKSKEGKHFVTRFTISVITCGDMNSDEYLCFSQHISHEPFHRPLDRSTFLKS